MAFNEFAFNTQRDEIACLGSTTTTLLPGTAVKVDTLATGISGTEIYQKVSAASKTDNVFGVVSAKATKITDKQFGQVVMSNARVFAVLMNAAAMKGDYVHVATMDGKWEKAATGDIAFAQLIEDATSGNLAWARPIYFKV